MRPIIGICALAALALACGDKGGNTATENAPPGLASCGTSTAVFTVSPVPIARIVGWVPLGNLNPPSHTFPTDHQYIYLSGFNTPNAEPVPLVAPGNITITGARRTSYSSGNVDYSVTFMACREVSAEFGHVTSLSDAVLSKLGAFDQQCDSYSPQAGITVHSCYTRRGNVPLQAGEPMGTSRGLDLSLFDSRTADITYANPARWTRNASGFDHFHVVPFSDYYAEPERSAIAAKVGGFDGRTRRTALPIGGSIGSDVPGTVQGSWVRPGMPTYPEPPHLAITPDPVDPSLVSISIGTSLTGMNAMVPRFTPSTGAINHAPASITPGPEIHCWEAAIDPRLNAGVLLVQLVDAATLKIEGRAGHTRTCEDERPWAFTGNAVTYVR